MKSILLKKKRKWINQKSNLINRSYRDQLFQILGFQNSKNIIKSKNKIIKSKPKQRRIENCLHYKPNPKKNEQVLIVKKQEHQ